MKIQRLILATNNSKDYVNFWPLLAYGWKKAGFLPTLYFVRSNINEEFPFAPIEGAEVHILDNVLGIHPGEYARMIRLYLPLLYLDEVCMISDMDIIPIKPSFFSAKVENIPDNFIALETCGVYTQEPWRYPMCYYIAKGSTFAEILRLKSGSTREESIILFNERLLNIYNMLPYWRGKADEYVFSILHSIWLGKETRTVKHRRAFKMEIENKKTGKRCPWVPTRLVLGKKGIWSRIDPNQLRRNKYIEVVVKAPPHSYIQEARPVLEKIGWDLERKPFPNKGEMVPLYKPDKITDKMRKHNSKITKEMINNVLKCL